ncbi:MAG: hypothetical protein J5J06_00280 [Phycisphaerae bacterium]|nr:hypothetical protein [Phycisphaerae bacterium]
MTTPDPSRPSGTIEDQFYRVLIGYGTPVATAALALSTRRAMNDTAAMFVANGQGGRKAKAYARPL